MPSRQLLRFSQAPLLVKTRSDRLWTSQRSPLSKLIAIPPIRSLSTTFQEHSHDDIVRAYARSDKSDIRSAWVRGAILTRNVAATAPEDIISKLQPLPIVPQPKPLRASIVLLLTKAFAQLATDDGFIERVIARLTLTGRNHSDLVAQFPDNVSSVSAQCTVLVAVVDRIPAPNSTWNVTADVRSSEDQYMQSLRSRVSPSDEHGYEGLAYCGTFGDDMLPYSTLTPAQPLNRSGPTAEKIESTITFEMCIPRKTALDSISAITTVQLPLANTLFSNGSPFTMFVSTWRLMQSSSSAEKIGQREVQHQEIRLPLALERATSEHPILESATESYLSCEPPLAIQLPLIALTPPRQITNSMGNIIRRLGEGSASQELEGAVSAFYARNNMAPEAAAVWALVIPKHLINQHSANETLAMAAADGELKRMTLMVNGQERESFTEVPAALIQRGARLHRVTSGGGGWGKKAGLLSLDADLGFNVTQTSTADDFDSILDFDGAIGERDLVKDVTSTGDYVRFYISPNKDLSTISESEVGTNVVKIWRDSLEFGVLPMLFSEMANSAPMSSDQDGEPMLLSFNDHFGAMSETGLSFGQRAAGVQVQTKIDVPYARISYQLPESQNRGRRSDWNNEQQDGTERIGQERTFKALASMQSSGTSPADTYVNTSTIMKTVYSPLGDVRHEIPHKANVQEPDTQILEHIASRKSHRAKTQGKLAPAQVVFSPSAEKRRAILPTATRPWLALRILKYNSLQDQDWSEKSENTASPDMALKTKAPQGAKSSVRTDFNANVSARQAAIRSNGSHLKIHFAPDQDAIATVKAHRNVDKQPDRISFGLQSPEKRKHEKALVAMPPVNVEAVLQKWSAKPHSTLDTLQRASPKLLSNGSKQTRTFSNLTVANSGDFQAAGLAESSDGVRLIEYRGAVMRAMYISVCFDVIKTNARAEHGRSNKNSRMITEPQMLRSSQTLHKRVTLGNDLESPSPEVVYNTTNHHTIESSMNKQDFRETLVIQPERRARTPFRRIQSNLLFRYYNMTVPVETAQMVQEVNPATTIMMPSEKDSRNIPVSVVQSSQPSLLSSTQSSKGKGRTARSAQRSHLRQNQIEIRRIKTTLLREFDKNSPLPPNLQRFESVPVRYEYINMRPPVHYEYIKMRPPVLRSKPDRRSRSPGSYPSKSILYTAARQLTSRSSTDAHRRKPVRNISVKQKLAVRTRRIATQQRFRKITKSGYSHETLEAHQKKHAKRLFLFSQAAQRSRRRSNAQENFIETLRALDTSRKDVDQREGRHEGEASTQLKWTKPPRRQTLPWEPEQDSSPNMTPQEVTDIFEEVMNFDPEKWKRR